MQLFSQIILIEIIAATSFKKWDDGQQKSINAKEVTRTGNNKLQTNIEGLNPGTTYTLRVKTLVSGNGDEVAAGRPSPELIIDTEAVSCTPKPSQCLILQYCQF